MNIISFDLEEWYFEKEHHGGRNFRYKQLDEMFAKLLSVLEEHNIKATFFCVGKLATDFPVVIKKIVEHGHEVGCHSNEHTWLSKMTEQELRSDTSEAVKALEDVAGHKIVSYRAPAFTITPYNKWAINVLAECGIEIDSSIFPASRSFGGFKDFPQDTPCLISHDGATIKEFPISLTPIFGKAIAYSGGGYFRLLPYRFTSRTMKNREYNICYFHLNDLISQKMPLKSKAEYEEFYKEPGTLKNRLLRYVKSNIGTNGGFDKLQRLIGDHQFFNICEANNCIDWEKANMIEL